MRKAIIGVMLLAALSMAATSCIGFEFGKRGGGPSVASGTRGKAVPKDSGGPSVASGSRDEASPKDSGGPSVASGSRDSGEISRARGIGSLWLEVAVYRGGASLAAAGADIRGAGIDRTFIDGDVVITGNGVHVRDLTIKGNLTIRANGVILERVRIMGSVKDLGKGNRW